MKRQIVATAVLVASFVSSNMYPQQYYAAFNPTNTLHASGASHAKNGLTWNSFSSAYLRSAHETFMKHGTKTKPLSALYFNSDDFRLSHLFENCLVPSNGKNYNPYMRILRMKPRVEYTEQGTSLGFSVDRTVAGGKGRVGVRARTQFKQVQAERKDTGSEGSAAAQEVFTYQMRPHGATSTEMKAVRLDALEAVPGTTVGSKTITYTPTTTMVFGTYDMANNTGDTVYVSAAYSPEGTVPFGKHVGTTYVAHDQVGTDIKGGLLPTTLSGLAEGTAYQFDKKDYSALDDDNAATVAARVASQDAKATVWVATVWDTVNTRVETNGKNIVDGHARSSLVTRYNANTDAWLHDRGYDLATDKHVGLGDTTLELFYMHDFSDSFSMELSGGVVAPTAAGKKQHGNPYNVHLGNNGHLEVVAGLGFDWQPARWLGITVHGDYGKVLKEREQRMAVAAGSLVKNIGPRADCEVEWQWARASADLCFVHPKVRGLSTTIGYRFMYKEREKVTFDDATMNSWLGGIYNSTAKTYTDTNAFALDNKLASANTEAMAHTVSVNCRYDVNEFFSLNCGSSYVVAGQNTPQETEMHFGCVVKL